jgi:hypothetical protein
MPRNTRDLQQLLRSAHLVTSLTDIQEAAKIIWPTDGTRIVADFTDHGVPHSDRVNGYAKKILDTNKGQQLSEEEIYVLLAGIYFHDIGMQCDVTQFARVREYATTELNANFEVEFRAATAGTFSPEEQASIRKNHHLLSVAWLACARRSSDGCDRIAPPHLITAAKSIPESLFSEVLAVCRFHTKSAISDCRLHDELVGNIRTRLLAAVLRLADELDIAYARVPSRSAEILTAFRPTDLGRVLWHLHCRTPDPLARPPFVVVKVPLNLEDNRDFGDAIKRLYIDKFVEKNTPLVECLQEHNFTVSLGKCTIVEHEDASPLDNDFTAAIDRLCRDDPLLCPHECNLDRLWKQEERVERAFRQGTGEEPYFTNREPVLKLLDMAWSNTPSPPIHVVVLTGKSGHGKSYVLRKWLHDLERDNWRGAQRIFGWTFYEGESEDAFFREALAWFGLRPAAQPWDNGGALAAALKRRPVLLLLDSIQWVRESKGNLPKGLEHLLTAVAQGQRGLCVVTSQCEVPALNDYVRCADRPTGGVVVKEIRGLPAKEGARLLWRRGVRRAGNETINESHPQLRRASQEWKGNPKTLKEIAGLLVGNFSGDILKTSALGQPTAVPSRVSDDGGQGT